MCLAYGDEVYPGRGFGERADALLDRCIDALGDGLMTTSLFGGFTGIAWISEHIAGGSADEPDANAEIDAVLSDGLARPVWPGGYDLIVGLVGLGVYAAERLHRPSGRAMLASVVGHLDAMSTPEGDGLTWHSRAELLPPDQRERYPDGYFNLGMAHGVPGVIALLGKAVEAGVEPERATRLLCGAVEWLMSEALPPGQDARFPMWRPGARGARPALPPARSGWCYGDPGVACALMQAARRARRPEWEEFALTLARGVTDRDPEACVILDPGLCHGAAGLAHMLNRLYQATGDESLRGAALHWFDRCLDMCEKGEEPLRFENPGTTVTVTSQDRLAEPGFLAGAAGTALALLAAITSVEPAWDRCMLLDIPLPRT